MGGGEQELPGWLSFNSLKKRFSGKPTIDDVRDYHVVVYASDTLETNELLFHVRVLKNRPLSKVTNADFHIRLAQRFSFAMGDETFQFKAAEGTPLVLVAKYWSGLNQWDPAGVLDWFEFNRLAETFTIEIRDATNVHVDTVAGRYNHTYRFLVIPDDAYDEGEGVEFRLHLVQDFPQVNPHSKSLQQFLQEQVDRQQIVLKPGRNIEFSVPEDLFMIDSPKKYYSAKLRPALKEEGSAPAPGSFEEVLFNGSRLIRLRKSYTQLTHTSNPWLKFDATSRRFYGASSASDINIFEVTACGSDGFREAQHSFFLEIQNSSPHVIEGQAFPDTAFTAGYRFSYALPYIFADSDDDPITYRAQVSLVADGKTLSYLLPDVRINWLLYDDERNLLTGQPTNQSVAYETIRGQKFYYQEFRVTILAYDPWGYFNQSSFLLTIKNSPPAFNHLPLQTQFSQQLHAFKLDEEFELRFNSSTFVDADQEQLDLQLVQANGLSCPSWMTLDEQFFTIKGTPSAEWVNKRIRLKVVAADAYQAIEDHFAFKVQPSLLYIAQLVSKILGNAPRDSATTQ